MTAVALRVETAYDRFLSSQHMVVVFSFVRLLPGLLTHCPEGRIGYGTAEANK